MELKELILTINNSLAIELPEKLSIDDLHARLTGYINELIRSNFEKLLTLLYRIDVSESKLKKILLEHQDKDAGEIIASLIIERQMQKIKLRSQNKPDTDIPELEKW